MRSLKAHNFQSKKLAVLIAGVFLPCLFGCSAETDAYSYPPLNPSPMAETALTVLSPDSSSSQYTEENCRIIEYSETVIHKGNLILVNNSTPFFFPKNQQKSLVTLSEERTANYKVKDKTVLVDSRAVDSLNQMMADFYKATGYEDVSVVSGFRTKEYQQMLLDREIRQSGRETAEKWVAQPGGSEHHTGLAIDFSLLYDNGLSGEYNGSGKTAWINQNCYQYGFIVRYPEEKKDITGIYYEPWHFRWVGLPHAAAITKNGMCLEEYIEYLKKFPFDGDHLQITYNGKSYEIWFEDGLRAHVPDEKPYTISGNNVDGFIVTAEQQ